MAESPGRSSPSDHFAPPARPDSPGQPDSPDQPGDLEAAFRELATADTVAFGGVGLAGQVLPSTAAYQAIRAVLPERAEALRPRLSWLLANGSPAGKAYAVTLLGRFDPGAARDAWRSLIDDRSEFTTFSGCVMDRATLGGYAAEHIGGAG